MFYDQLSLRLADMMHRRAMDVCDWHQWNESEIGSFVESKGRREQEMKSDAYQS